MINKIYKNLIINWLWFTIFKSHFFFMMKWLRNYFDILPLHIEKQIMASKENMAWNFIDSNSS